MRLNTLPTDSVTVTVGGAGGIVAVSPTALTFTTSTWSALQPVTVRALADDDATSATTTLTHAVGSLGDYASLNAQARPSVYVTVNDDDTQGLLIDTDPNTPEIDGGPLALNERPGPGNAKQYTVRLATRPTAAVQVSIASGDRAVSVDGDATPRTRTLTFSTSTWDAAQTVTATAAQDDDASDELAVAIAHEASGGDYEDVSASLTATTADDDVPALVLATSTLSAGVAEGSTATYTVRLATEPTGPVTVAATATGDATGAVEVDLDGGQAGVQSSLRFDAANWDVARTATVRGLPDDDAADGTATLRHAASGSDYRDVSAPDETFDVIDDDAPAVLPDATALAVNEGSTATYAVRLATQPVGGAVTVTATSTNAAAATVSPAFLTFGASDWNMRKTFRASGAGAGSATIMHAAQGADYGGAAAPPVAVTVRAAQAAGVRIEPPRLSLREGGAGAYGVRLNTDPGGAVTVTATSEAPGSVTVDGGSTRVLTFTAGAWNVEQTVAVSIPQEDDDFLDSTARVSHAVAGYAGVSSAPDLLVSVEDDDAPGLLFDPAGGLQLTELGAAGTYTARLLLAPSGTTTVAISSDDAGVVVDAAGGSPGEQSTLTFGAAAWNTAQTVTVRAVSDADAASETATLLARGVGRRLRRGVGALRGAGFGRGRGAGADPAWRRWRRGRRA